eukprot:15431404-Alexandrium_andersonii.AAC.1
MNSRTLQTQDTKPKNGLRVGSRSSQVVHPVQCLWRVFRSCLRKRGSIGDVKFKMRKALQVFELELRGPRSGTPEAPK